MVAAVADYRPGTPQPVPTELLLPSPTTTGPGNSTRQLRSDFWLQAFAACNFAIVEAMIPLGTTGPIVNGTKRQLSSIHRRRFHRCPSATGEVSSLGRVPVAENFGGSNHETSVHLPYVKWGLWHGES